MWHASKSEERVHNTGEGLYKLGVKHDDTHTHIVYTKATLPEDRWSFEKTRGKNDELNRVEDLHGREREHQI